MYQRQNEYKTVSYPASFPGQMGGGMWTGNEAMSYLVQKVDLGDGVGGVSREADQNDH